MTLACLAQYYTTLCFGSSQLILACKQGLARGQGHCMSASLLSAEQWKLERAKKVKHKELVQNKTQSFVL